MDELRKIQLGQLLLDSQVISQDQFDAALARHNASGEKLGRVLIDMGFVKEEVLLEMLSKQLRIPFVDLKNYNFDTKQISLLPEIYARRLRAIVLRKDEDQILVGMVDPLDIVATDTLTQLLKLPIKIALVREVDLM